METIKQYGALLGVGCSVLFSYMRYKKDLAAWKAANNK